jgi:hypothetical protein
MIGKPKKNVLIVSAILIILDAAMQAGAHLPARRYT